MINKYDLLIIGAGPGGYTAAIKAAKLKLKVAVIERNLIGGTCLNQGCIPTKALLHASAMFALMQNGDDFGVSADFISYDFKKMQQYKQKSVQQCRQQIEQLFAQYRIDVITGHAIVGKDKSVEVRNNGVTTWYQADHIILAAGARPAIPDLPGSDLPGVWTSDQLLNADIWNFDRLTILGGGVIGVEMATIFSSLCASVAIIEKEGQLLGPMDQEVSQALQEDLTEKGINILCNTTVKEIRKEDGLVCVATTQGGEFTFKAGQILIATGRIPDMEQLFQEPQDFALDGARLKVDAEFMTSQPDIYAIGDMVADIQLAHAAAAQGIYVVEKIAGVPHSIRLNIVPSGMFTSLPIVPNCIYTDPEVATVGVTETGARAANLNVRCGRYNMKMNGKSIISNDENGFIRLVFEEYSMQLIGAQIVCKRATDMISEMATAIANGLTASQLSLAMRAHPTYSEGISAAIEDAVKKGDGNDENGSL